MSSKFYFTGLTLFHTMKFSVCDVISGNVLWFCVSSWHGVSGVSFRKNLVDTGWAVSFLLCMHKEAEKQSFPLCLTVKLSSQLGQAFNSGEP